MSSPTLPSLHPTLPSPKEIAAALQQKVIGQQTAVREMAIALSKHLSGLATGNILMIGSSGTGKTTVMRAVEEYLAARPDLAGRSTVIRLHANVLGEEAVRGAPGQAVLGRLLERAREQLGEGASRGALLERAASGVAFVDEVDKIRSHVGGHPNPLGIRAQEALLTLMENEAVPMELPAWAGGGSATLDTGKLLFVCGGAFEGLYDAVYDRVTVGKDRGALQPFTVVEEGTVSEETRFRLRDWLRNDDLFDYGMTPQFLARFDAVVLLEDLRVEQLVRIFLSGGDSGYEQAVAYFRSRGIELALSPAAVRRIAEEAARQPRLGARALKEVFRRVIRDYEFDPDPHRAAGGALMIDAAEVEAAL